MNLLTPHATTRQTIRALETSRVGRGNPSILRRNSANSGRFFCACCKSLWRLVQGTRKRGRFLSTGISTPVFSRHPIAVESGLVAPVSY